MSPYIRAQAINAPTFTSSRIISNSKIRFGSGEATAQR